MAKAKTKKKGDTIEIQFDPDLKNRTLEDKVNILLENQENVSKVKAKDLKEFILELEVANYDDQLFYCNAMVEHFEENTLKEKNCQKIFGSATIQQILRAIVS